MSRFAASAAVALAMLSHAFLATAHLSMPMEKKSVLEDGTLGEYRGIMRRAIDTTTWDALAYGGSGVYCINITVGTPPQIQTVLFDTGSWDLFVVGSDACNQPGQVCRGGTYTQSQSSTAAVVAESGMNLSFADTTWVAGDFVSDVFGIGNVQIPNVQFGTVATSYTPLGVLQGLIGVGYSIGDGNNVGVGTTKHYPNVIDVLQEAGVTKSRLFSLWLGDNGLTSTGNVIFGGVDTSLFSGQMAIANIASQPSRATGKQLVQNPYTVVSGLGITVNGATTAVQSSNVQLPLIVNLDSGTSGFEIPADWYNQIMTAWNLPPTNFSAPLPCSHLDDTVSLQVQFSQNLTIEVPAKNLFVPAVNIKTGQFVYDSNGQPLCNFMLSSMDNSKRTTYLGDPILRSMYVVYDWDNGQMGLAQSNPNPGKSNVLDIPAGPNQLASALQSVNSGVATTMANSNAIASAMSATANFTFSSVSPVGTATGFDAYPTDAYISGAQSFSVVNSAGSTVDPFAKSLAGLSSTSSTAATTEAPGSAPTSASSSSVSPSPSKGAASVATAESIGVVRMLAVWLGLLIAGFLLNL